MSAAILLTAAWIAHAALAAAMVLAAVRMVIGPRAQDRVLAMDALSVGAMLQLIAFSVRTGNTIYFEAALIIGMLSFIATVALAKFLMRGQVIE